MDGIIVVNKPKDFTSFDVVAVMRRLAKEKKAGHTGTLDPMATGVLPILFGNATKAQSLLPDSDKEYIARFKWGMTTDTLDITGKVTSQSDVQVSREEVENCLPHFTGDIFQLPPMYSAVKKDGKRLYDLARQGIEVEREQRPITIHRLQLLDYDPVSREGSLKVLCTKGTYIRTLIDDMGQRLKCGGTLTDLCRTMACGFTLEQAVTLEEAKRLAEEDRLHRVVQSVEDVFMSYGQTQVTQPQAMRFSNGGGLDLGRISLPAGDGDKTIYRVKAPDGVFIGLGIVNQEKQELSILKLFNIRRTV